MFVDAPSFPITVGPRDADNPTLARRALFDVNSVLADHDRPVARHWAPYATRRRSFGVCLVGVTMHQDRDLACAIASDDDTRSPWVREVERRFEMRSNDFDVRMPITAAEAAHATGYRFPSERKVIGASTTS